MVHKSQFASLNQMAQVNTERFHLASLHLKETPEQNPDAEQQGGELLRTLAVHLILALSRPEGREADF